MSQPVLIKAYAALSGASEALAEKVAALGREACPASSFSISLDSGMLQIAFEGVWLPEEEILDALREEPLTGKLDALDIENWALRRYVFNNGRMESKRGSLNNALDYSGF